MQNSMEVRLRECTEKKDNMMVFRNVKVDSSLFKLVY